MAITDEERREIEDLLREREKKNRQNKIFSNISMKTRIIIFAFFVGFLLYAKKQAWPMSDTVFWGCVIAVAVWLIFLRDTGLPTELTDRQLRISLGEKLRWSQQHPIQGNYSVPRDVKFEVSQVGNRTEHDERVWREYLVKYRYHDGRVDDMIARMDAFTGDIIGLAHTEYGFTGEKPASIKTIASPQLRDLKMQKQYLDPGRFR